MDVTLTFKSDDSFTFIEQVRPILGGPDAGARSGSGGCVVTDPYEGTYSSANSNGVDTVTMNFASGTANVVSGCNDPALNSAGSPMTGDAIESFRSRGYLPPGTVNYVATSTTLILSSPNAEDIGIGRGTGTRFARSP